MKNKFVVFLILILISIIFYSSCYASNEITLISDPYPPYVLDNPSMHGYVTDIAIRAFEISGYKAVYKNIPFKRAIAGVKEGEYDGILAISKGGREDFLYPENTLGTFKNKFFKRKGDSWLWKNDVNNLEQVVLGYIIGYKLGNAEFQKYINNNKNSRKIQMVAGSSALAQNIRKLNAKRIDIMVADEKVIRYTAKLIGLEKNIESAGTLSLKENIEYVSIGFSRKNPKAKEYIKAFDKGIIEMKKNGEIKEILDKYGLIEF